MIGENASLERGAIVATSIALFVGVYLIYQDYAIEKEQEEALADKNGEKVPKNLSNSEQINEENKRSKDSVATNYQGLPNLGNTCYMNSLIQALSGCPQYVEYCESIVKNQVIENILSQRDHSEENQDDKAAKIERANDILHAFILVLLQVCYNDEDAKQIYRLHQLISEDNEYMRFNEQADAHELNMFLQDHLISLVPKRLRQMSEGLKGKIVYEPQRGKKTEQADDQSYIALTNSALGQIDSKEILAQSCTSSRYLDKDECLTESITDIFSDEEKKIQKQSQNPILSMHETTIECEECCKVEGPSTNLHRFEFFLDINLDIPPSSPFQKVDLRTLLLDYFKPEQIEGYNCIKCSLRNYISQAKSEENPRLKEPDFVKALEFLEKMYKTEDIDQEEFAKKFKKFKERTGNKSEHQIATKKVIIRKKKLVIKPPKTLCIHFNRLTYDAYGNQIMRLNQIDFPELLDLNNLEDGVDGEKCCTFDIELKYKLCSVIEHRGSPVFGHYIAAKRIDEEKWLFCNDNLLHEMPNADQVLQNMTPYMLFYEKIMPQSE